MTLEFRVEPGEDGLCLGPFLRRRGVSLALVRSLKGVEGGLLVDGAPAHTNRKLAAGQLAGLGLPAETGCSAAPQNIPLELLYHSRDALVVNKPAGMVTHPGPSHRAGSLANAFCGMMQRQGLPAVFRPVGRLDADTSGLALMAMNAASAPLLARSLQKSYLALAGGRLPAGEGIIDAPLAPAPGSSVRQQVHPAGRPSTTRYRVLGSAGGGSLVLVRPQTGRTHQIRAHFAHLGFPLLGDALYGGERTLMRRHALHCAGIRFAELAGNQPGLWRPLPNDMLAALHSLGLDPRLAAPDFAAKAAPDTGVQRAPGAGGWLAKAPRG